MSGRGKKTLDMLNAKTEDPNPREKALLPQLPVLVSRTEYRVCKLGKETSSPVISKSDPGGMCRADAPRWGGLRQEGVVVTQQWVC